MQPRTIVTAAMIAVGAAGPACGGSAPADLLTHEVAPPQERASTPAAAPTQGRGATAATAPEACHRVGAWKTTEPFADDAHVSHPLPSFALGSRLFVHTIAAGGRADRKLLVAEQEPDGALGPWQVASNDHGGGPHGFTALRVGDEAFHFRNGHIARYPIDAAGRMAGDVELLEASMDDSFAGERYVWDAAVYAPFASGGRVFHLGGYSFTRSGYALRAYESAVPIGVAFADAGVDFPADAPGKAAFVATEVGGDDGVLVARAGADSRHVYAARVVADGTMKAWSAATDLPAGGRGDLFAAGRTVFAIAGAHVLAADVGSDGRPSAWVEQPPLPEPQIDVTWSGDHLEGASYGVIGDHVYVTGPKRVFFAELRAEPCPS